MQGAGEMVGGEREYVCMWDKGGGGACVCVCVFSVVIILIT